MLLSGAAPHLSTTAGGGPSSSPTGPSEDEASTPNPKSISLEMWRAFARMDEDASRDAIRRLEQLQGGSIRGSRWKNVKILYGPRTNFECIISLYEV